MTDQPDESTRGRPSKVARLIDEYNLQGLGDEMERLWTAKDDRSSLRNLATHFNQRLLEAVMKTEDIQLLDGDADNIYRLLSDSDVNPADRTRARRQLEREGIDVDSMMDDFVTYQAIRTYLTKHRNAEYSPDETDPLVRMATDIQRLRGRVRSVTEGKLEQLQNTGDISLGEFRTLVDVRVVCENCNTQYDVDVLLEAGACNCSS